MDGGFNIQTKSSTNTLLSSQKSDAHQSGLAGGDLGGNLRKLTGQRPWASNPIRFVVSPAKTHP